MPKIVLYGYPASPYYQKLVLTLSFLGLEYSICAQPNTLPRPDFASIGITYRRIPLLSIDGDMYCDTSLIISKLCALAGQRNYRETEALGQSMFGPGAMLIPYTLIADDRFLKDRSALTGRPWTEKSIRTQRGPALSAFISHLAIVQELLANNASSSSGGAGFVRGSQMSMADIHLLFLVQWVLAGHKGSSPEVSPESHPDIYAWMKRCNEALPKQTKRPARVTFASVRDQLTSSDSRAGQSTGANGTVQDVLPFKVGMQVSVTPMDTGKSHPQVGTLLALDAREVSVATAQGVHIHFPRIGYMVRPASSSPSDAKL